MNPNCGLPPLVNRHTVRRRSSSSGPSVRGEGGGGIFFLALPGVGVPSGSRSPCLVARLNFGLFGGLSSPSSRRLIFLVLSGLSFFWSFRGLDFLPSSRALDFFCWSVRDLISWSFLGFDLLVPPGPTLVPSGVHFPCLFGGLIFFGSVGCPSFMIPFGDALLGPFGARLLTSPADITGKGWSCVAGLVCCFFFSHLRTLSSDSCSSPLFLFL